MHSADPPEPGLRDPDRVLALAYVPQPAKAKVAALWALDERLDAIVAAAREPSLGLIRLAWWRDALEALADGPPPAEPLLIACAAAGLDGRALAAMTPAWEALLDDPALGDDTVARHGDARGAALFALAGEALGASSGEDARLRAAGAGWALADLARRHPARAAAIRAAARVPLVRAMATRWPRRLRPLGQLAALALGECGDAPSGPRGRAFRVLRHQLTGR